MHLTRLDMIGFKSFPEKIKLEFDKGITAIVGPNGSGKSNVSDAMRWVLGEQSAKSLRGAKMEDVIFSGTTNRKALGFAEVTMVIDNQSGGLKLDYDEIAITRRVYRSGDSEYSINGTSCRLKDIHELFMDTGLGKEGYSIIGQGKIEEVLASKGEERRLLIEEAAGIVKYKTRRMEALNKLEKERSSLERVEDIINEIEQGLDSLLEQSEKAKKFLKLAEELKLVQINIFISEVDNAQSKIDKIDANLEIITSQIADIEKRKHENEAKISEYEDEIAKFELIIEELSAKIAENRSEFEQSENDILLKEEQVRHIDSDIKNIEARITERQKAITLGADRLCALEGQLKELSEELAQKNASLEKKNEQFADFLSVVTEEELEIQTLNQNIYEFMGGITDASNNVSRLESNYEQLENRMEQIGAEMSAAWQKNEADGVEAERISRDISACDGRIDKLKDSLKELESEKGQFSTELSKNKEMLRANAAKQSEAEYRTKILKELESSHEGYSNSTKSILAAKKSSSAEWSGVVGAVGELVSVDKQYETAIEIALGASVQNVVTKTENDAKKAIEYLKDKKAGRATFLPITTIKPRNTTLDKALLNEKGVLGVALDLCSFDKSYQSIFSSLLANTAVVENMDTAIILAKKYDYANRIVTLEGELLSPGGSITGGSVSGKTSGIFSRKRELGTLEVEMDSLTVAANKLEVVIASIRKQLDAIDFQTDESAKELQSAEIHKSAVVEKLNQLNILLKAHAEQLDLLAAEEKSLMDGIVECNTRIREFELLIKAKEQEIEQLKAKIEHLNEQIVTKRTEKDSRYNEITELKVVIASLDERLISLNEQIEALKQSGASDISTVDKLKAEIDKKSAAMLQHKCEIEELGVKKDALKELNTSLHAKIEAKQSDFRSKRYELKNLEESRIDELNQLSVSNNEKVKLELQKEHVDGDLRKVYDHMWNEYELTYNSAKEYSKLDLSPTKLASTERALKSDIRNLGDVNVAAIEEYRTVSERYEFLTSQAADIKEAEEKLKELIAQLSEMMEKQFREHFVMISENFSSVFSDIFGGGTASLKLSDENNVLESGIEIIAKPPGKALQNLSLLSGGERALTATALLFAILRMKPSPFCILDEVEAALDDANAARYIKYLQKLRKDTQFILITHRKSVMEAADVLYGITMQEQGISALVSVKLEGETA